MRAMHTPPRFELQPGETILFTCHQRQTMVVQAADRASIWMTRLGDRRDYWLGAGDVVELHAGDDILLGLDADAACACVAVVARAQASLRARTAFAGAEVLAKMSARLRGHPAQAPRAGADRGACTSA